MNTKIYFALVVYAAMLIMFNHAAAFEKTDYLVFKNREIGLTHACTYYTSNFAATLTTNTATVKNEWINPEYLNSAGFWEYAKPTIINVPVYTPTKKCYDTITTDNLTAKQSTKTTCYYENIISGYTPTEKMEWYFYDWKSPATSKSLRYCANLLPIIGMRSIEHIPEINDIKFTEYDYWNSSCSYKMNLSVSNPNITTTMKVGMQISFTMSHADYLASGYCANPGGNDVYITYNNTEIDRINETAFGANGVKLSWKLQNDLSAGATSMDYAMYCNCTGLTDPKNNVNNIATNYANATAIWLMNTNTSRIIDETSNGNTLFVKGNLPLTTICPFGGCLYFNDNINNYLNGSTFLGNSGTGYLNGISFVFSGADITGIENAIFSKETSNSQNLYYAAGEGATGDLYTQFQASLTQSINYYRPYERNGTFHIYGFTLARNGSHYIYGDGKQGNLTNTVSTYFPADGNNKEFLIGLSPNNNNPYKGYIDRLSVYNAVFNATDMNCLSNGNSQFPFTVCLNTPASAAVTSIETYTPPAPPVIPKNVTAKPDITRCTDNQTLFQRNSENITINGISEYTTIEKYITCSNGCTDSLSEFGAGCNPTPFNEFLLETSIIIVFIAMVFLLSKASKHKRRKW